MKTTVDISDDVLEAARRLAARERTTLRALIEAGLRMVIKERKRRPQFQLRDASFKGEGLQSGFQGAGWERVREAVYEDHGG